MNKIGFELDKSKISQERFLSVLNFYEENDIPGKIPGIYVNGLFIPFDSSDKNIGIMFSGGADSSMLLYILCRIIEEFNYDIKITPISIARYFETHEWLVDAIKKTYQYFKNKFPNIIQDQQWGFIPTAFEATPIQALHFNLEEKRRYLPLWGKAKSDVYFFYAYSNYAAKTLNLSSIYDATTTNPTIEEIPESPKFRDQDILSYPTSLEKIIYKNNFFKFINPFILIEKNWVMAQYDNFNLNDLKELTRSCIEIDSPDDGCGKSNCFHCIERKWGEKYKEVFLKSYHD